MVLNFIFLNDSIYDEPYYILYVKFHQFRNYLEKDILPLTDQWHIYGHPGDVFPLCISQDYEKLLKLSSLLNLFPVCPFYTTIGIEKASDFIKKYYEEDEETFLENVLEDYFYFESFLNKTSSITFQIDIAIQMLENHINDENLFLQTENTIFLENKNE